MTRMNSWTMTAAALLLLAGCRDIEVTTTVHRDGSIDREVVVNTDAEGEREPAFPLVEGEGWESQTREVRQEGETRWVTTYRRSFEDVEILQETMQPDAPDAYPIRPEVDLDRQFRWFTTRYVWTESVPAVSPYDAIPLREWFSQAEIDSFVHDEESDGLRERFERWQARNFIQDLIDRAAERAEDVEGWEASDLESRAGAVFDSVEAREEELDLDDLTPAMLDIMRDVYGKDPTSLEPALRAWEEDLMAYLEGTSGLGEEDYTFHVRMPGLLVDTSARKVEGNRASWDLDPDVLHFTGFEMYAMSRVSNTWALWVTGLLLLLAAGAAVLSTLRRRG